MGSSMGRFWKSKARFTEWWCLSWPWRVSRKRQSRYEMRAQAGGKVMKESKSKVCFRTSSILDDKWVKVIVEWDGNENLKLGKAGLTSQDKCLEFYPEGKIGHRIPVPRWIYVSQLRLWQCRENRQELCISQLLLSNKHSKIIVSYNSKYLFLTFAPVF